MTTASVNPAQAFSHVLLVNTARNLSRDGGPAEQRCAEHGDADEAVPLS